MKYPLLFAVFFGVLSAHTQAQDMHFSQFYADGLRMNPAATGNFNGDYRIGLNVKNQWRTVPAPYNTGSIYADFVPYRKATRRGIQSWLGTGINLLYDQAGNGNLSALEARATAAFHFAFSPNLYASVGGAATYRQRSIDFSRLYFGNQWTEAGGFDTSLPNLENGGQQSISYLDLAAGANLTLQVPQSYNVYLGASLAHLNQPVESFTNLDNRLGTRLSLNAGGSIRLPRLTLEPAFYYSTQKKASEWVLGTNLVFGDANNNARYTPQKTPFRFYAGIWYRFNDALIPLVGTEWKRYRLLLTYDINLSALQTASGSRGGFELSLVHVGAFKKRKTTPVYCPRF